MAKRLTAIPIIMGVISTLLFAVQGGFGGGHGKFDFIIGWLGFPFIFLTEQFHLPLTRFDFINVVLFPALLNVLLVWSLVELASKLLKRSPDTP